MTEEETKIKEENFLKELNFFNNETEALVRYVYSSGALNDVIANNKSVRKAANKNPYFWNSVLLSFTDSMFITLGRIFDVENKKNEKCTIHTLFKTLEDGKEIFSKDAFSKRWVISHESMLAYKDHCMKSFYDMKQEDWRKFKKEKKSLSKEYQDLYRPIRDSIAHRILTNNDEIRLIVDKVPVRDMEKFCTKLRNLHEGLWQLYYNGGGPIVPLKTGSYSSKGFVAKKYKPYHPGPITYQYSQDAKNALILLSKGDKYIVKKRN